MPNNSDRSTGPNSPRTPQAFHVGFSKCASTFLQTYFEEHSSVFLVNQSHYVAPFSLSEFPQGLGEYYARFNDARSGQVSLESDEHIIMPIFHPTLGAAATTMGSVGEVISRMKLINTEAKVIVVVRNQISLLASRYSEYVLCGGTKSVDEFVDEFLCCSIDKENYYQNFYSRILIELREAFSSANVLLLFQEELASDESIVINKLSTFLGVDPLQPSKRGMVAKRIGLSPMGIRAMRLLNRAIVIKPKQSYNEAKVRIPFLLYKVIQRMVRILDFYAPRSLKGDKKYIISERQAARIASVFLEDNRKLQGLVDVDLAQLGYPVAELK